MLRLGPIMTTIPFNLQQVRDRIRAACEAAGRAPAEVQLLAVSKTFGPQAVQAAWAAGQFAFGENYIQEAVLKISAFSALTNANRSAVQWHCIGPIQSNKTRLVAEHFDWVHSVDRLKTAQRLSEQRPASLAPLQVCIQLNVDGGANKSGVVAPAAAALAQQVAALPGLCLRGLMSIPEPAPDFASAVAVFARVRAVFDALRAGGLKLDTLSMGMSADLEAAIHAGSTQVRVGNAIFGAR